MKYVQMYSHVIKYDQIKCIVMLENMHQNIPDKNLAVVSQDIEE